MYKCRGASKFPTEDTESSVPIINFHIRDLSVGGSFGLPRFMRTPYDVAAAFRAENNFLPPLDHRTSCAIVRPCNIGVVICRIDEVGTANIFELNRLAPFSAIVPANDRMIHRGGSYINLLSLSFAFFSPTHIARTLSSYFIVLAFIPLVTF